MAKRPDNWQIASSYQQFVKQEGAPLYEGSALEDLATLPLHDWQRRGGKVAYTRLGEQEKINLQVVEIPPRGELEPEHHLYESVMYVLQGRGATVIWQEGEPKQTIEWEKNALLAIPLNAWHQEFNSSSDEPCRIVFGTNMAHVLNLYHNSDFVFNNSFTFKDRYSYSWQHYFSDVGKQLNLRLFETNFIPDVTRFTLDPYPERGRRTSVMRLCMASASLSLHIAETSPGTYMTAHKHGPGAHVLCVGGEGYELLFMPGEKNRRRLSLNPTAVVSPRLNEYHQHMNTGATPLRMLAFKEQGYSHRNTAQAKAINLTCRRRTRIPTRKFIRLATRTKTRRSAPNTTASWKEKASRCGCRLLTREADDFMLPLSLARRAEQAAPRHRPIAFTVERSLVIAVAAE